MKLTTAQREAIAMADAHLNNAGLARASSMIALIIGAKHALQFEISIAYDDPEYSEVDADFLIGLERFRLGGGND